ncbi:MAG: D-glycero-beta-D-manno-heptose 1-phosphate adenylyltransferase [Ginsengibacter sp.]
MRKTQNLSERILPREEVPLEERRIRLKSKTIAFTNGVFDILHEGHIALLSQAATFADVLIVGINSDDSVKRLKGETRPVNGQDSRALVISSLVMVDYVVIFDEDTPLELIKILKPDVLIKGGDYTMENIVGAKETNTVGGKVEIISLVKGFSTTAIIEKMKTG